MNYVTNKERQEIGYRKFLEVHLKETAMEKSIKSTIKLYVILILFSALMIVYKNTRWIGITAIILSIVMPVFYKIMMYISRKKSKKIKLSETLERVEHIFGETYEVKTYFTGGSENSAKYEYSEIFKVIDSEEFFYIYVNPYSAMPLDKQSIDNIDEFINFMKEKNIFIKGITENEK